MTELQLGMSDRVHTAEKLTVTAAVHPCVRIVVDCLCRRASDLLVTGHQWAGSLRSSAVRFASFHESRVHSYGLAAGRSP